MNGAAGISRGRGGIPVLSPGDAPAPPPAAFWSRGRACGGGQRPWRPPAIRGLAEKPDNIDVAPSSHADSYP